MFRYLIAGLMFLATPLAAQLNFDAFDYVDGVTLEDGRILATGMGEWGTALTLDGEVLEEDAQIGLIDAGAAGILVEIASGGNSCPYRFKLVDRATGEFRQIDPETEMPTVFAQFEALMGVVPDANLILMWRYETRSYAQAYIWNGYALNESVIPISRDGAPKPMGGQQVMRWDDVDPFEMLKDPVEQMRLLDVISEDQFDRLSWLMGFRSPALMQGDFLVADGCVKYLCDAQNAVIAVRASDGQAFVRIFDEGDVTLGVPEGEDLPPALLEHAARYP